MRGRSAAARGPAVPGGGERPGGLLRAGAAAAAAAVSRPFCGGVGTAGSLAPAARAGSSCCPAGLAGLTGTAPASAARGRGERRSREPPVPGTRCRCGRLACPALVPVPPGRRRAPPASAGPAAPGTAARPLQWGGGASLESSSGVKRGCTSSAFPSRLEKPPRALFHLLSRPPGASVVPVGFGWICAMLEQNCSREICGCAFKSLVCLKKKASSKRLAKGASLVTEGAPLAWATPGLCPSSPCTSQHSGEGSTGRAREGLQSIQDSVLRLAITTESMHEPPSPMLILGLAFWFFFG